MKNKIFKYDFLIVGGGLIGALAGLALHKKNFKVLVIDKKKDIPLDQRTLAVNANSKEFLEQLGVWEDLISQPQSINKIVIKDYINTSPLIFSNQDEPMGNVIFNTEMLKIVRKRLKNISILKTGVNINLEHLSTDNTIYIDKKFYLFKKIIISVGKDHNANSKHKSIVFDKGYFSHVGFFTHNFDHENIAYEIFNKEGPLAVLPCPSTNKRKSTFIYSTNKIITNQQIFALVKKHFYKSHGKIVFKKDIHKFPVTPHLKKYNKNYIYIGDTLKSIHPVAGQGWNLGVKDIQTLCNLTEQYSSNSKILNSLYYSRRIIDSSAYMGFTSFINFLYENQNSINKKLIKLGYEGLRNFKAARSLFVKQAMGRINLTG